MKFEKPKTLILSLINLILLFLVGLFIIIYVFVLKDPTPQNIYSMAQNFVVEVKSQTNDVLTSYGTAVLVSADGYFISNAHVTSYTQSGLTKEFENYYIRFSFETDYRPVNLVNYDSEMDISLLKLKEKPSFNLKTVKMADSTKIKPGDEVYAVGNGMNHGIGLTHGYVSLPRVNIEYDGLARSVIQCDLIVNEGNSGGALLNSKGDLLGLTTFRIKDNSGNPIYGIVFSIPSELLIEFLIINEIAYRQ